MSFTKENAGEGRGTPPAKGSSPLSGTEGSVGKIAAPVFDNLQEAQLAAQVGQHTTDGAVPIIAPAAPQPERWASIPLGLRERPQWCIARPDKAPLIATQGLPLASTTDPSTWRTFNEACSLAAHHGLHIGYMLHESDPFTCIDLDVKEYTTPEQLDRFERIVDEADSYTEYSRGGRGFHIWVEGTFGAGRKRDGVEVYSQKRFMICTGNVRVSKPVSNRQAMLDEMRSRMPEDHSAKLSPLIEVAETDSDEVIWERAAGAANGEKFQQLWKGDWEGLQYPSRSEADHALLAILAFYSKSDEQVRRLFRMSELGKREKAAKDNRYLDISLGTLRGQQQIEDERVASVKASFALLAGGQQTPSATQAVRSGSATDSGADATAPLGDAQPIATLWESPIPLRRTLDAVPYPLHLLPPLIRNAIAEVEHFIQAPTALIAASALSAVSAVVQGHVSVQRGAGLDGPASLFFLTLALSGERKSSADKYFTEAINDWEAQQAEVAREEMDIYRAQLVEWECIEEGYKLALKQSAKGGKPDASVSAQLLQHQLSKPIEPRIPSILRMDDTPEALGVALMRWPIAAILSNEAGIIFGAHGMNPESVMRNMAGLNLCWDGARIRRDRTSTQSVNIEGMRVTMGLMVQPETLHAFLSKQGVLARGIGFLARFLVANPVSTQGKRFYRERAPGAPAVAAFNARAAQLLNADVKIDQDTGRLTTTYLPLSPEAKALWVQFHDVVERELGQGHGLYDVQDVASKAADNAARLAVCLHTFCDHTGTPVVGVESMKTGTELMHWYLHEALRFCRSSAVPESLRKAERLEEWLMAKFRAGMALVPTRELKQLGPNELRGTAGADAFAVLEDHHRAARVTHGLKKFYCLNPDVVKEHLGQV